MSLNPSQYSSVPTNNDQPNASPIKEQFVYQPSANQMNDIYAANSQNVTDWISHCKSLLIEMECMNIETRASHWTSIINIQTNHTNQRLGLTQSIALYKYHSNPQKHLHFLAEWKGLKMRQITNFPRTYNEFEAKAKNWLNGRRAPNYGSTLFPDMIQTAEKYAKGLAEELFVGNAEYIDLYFNVLMYSYLAALCSERITMNNASKRTPLLLENSLKYCKTPTAKLLQNYAQEYPYPHQFPSHLRQASDFFHTKYDHFMKLFLSKQKQKNPKKKGESSSLSTSENSSSTLSVITPVSPQQHLRHNVAVSDSNNNGNSNALALGTVPVTNTVIENKNVSDMTSVNQATDIPPIPSIASIPSFPCNFDSNGNNFVVPLPMTLLNTTSMNSNSENLSCIASQTPNALYPNYNVVDEDIVQLTRWQYEQLMSKIDRLETTQMQQRQVIECLTGKLHDLENRNESNMQMFHQNTGNKSMDLTQFQTNPNMPTVPVPNVCHMTASDNNVMPSIDGSKNGAKVNGDLYKQPRYNGNVF